MTSRCHWCATGVAYVIQSRMYCIVELRPSQDTDVSCVKILDMFDFTNKCHLNLYLVFSSLINLAHFK